MGHERDRAELEILNAKLAREMQEKANKTPQNTIRLEFEDEED
jgi:hypothetical protein